jgi:hypothetical protein
MGRLIYFFFFMALIGCKPIQLTSGLNDHEAFKLYRQAVKSDSTYFINYNPDSTYAICILNDGSDMVSEPISFFIVDIKDRREVLASINEYHKAEWIDNSQVKLTTYKGIGNFSRDLNKNMGSNFKETIFNVISGNTQLSKSDNEK